MPSQNAQRTAPWTSPRPRNSWWARVSRSTHSAPRPIRLGGGRQPLQILRLQRRLPVRGGELAVGVRPRLPAEGLPAPIERFGRRHIQDRSHSRRSQVSGGATSRDPLCLRTAAGSPSAAPGSEQRSAIRSSTARGHARWPAPPGEHLAPGSRQVPRRRSRRSRVARWCSGGLRNPHCRAVEPRLHLPPGNGDRLGVFDRRSALVRPGAPERQAGWARAAPPAPAHLIRSS